MIKYFKSKKNIYHDGFSDGWEQHKISADKKIRSLKIKLNKQNKKIKDIEKSLKILSVIFNDARQYAVQLDRVSTIQLMQIAREYQENKDEANNILQICRSFEKEITPINNKIEKYKIN